MFGKIEAYLKRDEFMKLQPSPNYNICLLRTWNSLPLEVTSSHALWTFQTKLKTRLFSASFP